MTENMTNKIFSLMLEFFLNASEIQWIQQSQGITEAWIGLNLKILSATCVLLVLW